MTRETTRFIVASDFELHCPFRGLDAVPESWEAVARDAPRQAAERVFDWVLDQQVDFLVLAGNLLDPRHSSPAQIGFLQGQLERLAEREIPVYWAQGQADQADHWPPSVRFPENVHVFDAAHAEAVSHFLDTGTVTLVGKSYRAKDPFDPGSYRGETDSILTLGVLGAEPNRAPVGRSAFSSLDFDLTLFGGSRQPGTVKIGDAGSRKSARIPSANAQAPLVHSPGSPQLRSWEPEFWNQLGGKNELESAVIPSGSCTLVEFTPGEQLRFRPLPTHAIRWVGCALPVNEATTESALLEQMLERLLTLEAEGVRQLVNWRLDGPLSCHLRAGLVPLLPRLRAEQAELERVWSVSLAAGSPPSIPASWFQEESLLGDFLQASAADHDEVPLIPSLAARHEAWAAALSGWLVDHGTAEQDEVFHQVSSLGVELLSPQNNRPS